MRTYPALTEVAIQQDGKGQRILAVLNVVDDTSIARIYATRTWVMAAANTSRMVFA